MGAFEAEPFEWGGETEVFQEAELTELAHALLSVTTEAELDQFLGGVIRKAGSAIGGGIRSPIGRAVGGYLKGAARRALPLAGGALGGYIGGPLGAKIGSGLASAAGSALGLEAESVMGEDQEVEGAKTFARMAGEAVKGAVAAAPSASPGAVAQAAVTAAARKHAPGLLHGAPGKAARRLRQEEGTVYNSNRIAELQGDRNGESGYPARPRPLDFDGWPGFAPQLEEEQAEPLYGVTSTLQWNRIKRPSPLPGPLSAKDAAVIWGQLWEPLRKPELRTKACVYIIAKERPGSWGWDFVKVGESRKLESLMSRKVSGAGQYKNQSYCELVVRHGYTLFWALTIDEKRIALQLLIARILLRVTKLPGHDRPRGVIKKILAPVDVKNVLPLELRGYALVSFGGHGTETGTTFDRYPKHDGDDVLGAARHLKLKQATDHAF
jgi:hypothetical protein